MDYTYDELVKNIQNAYCDSSQAQVSGFSPAFVYNNPEIEQNVLTAIESCLKDCDEFMFSVAFITDSGLNLLKQVFLELCERNIPVKGRIITTNYLDFTEPKALKDLLQFENIECRMYCCESNNKIGFHTKGYLFKYGTKYKAIIGSSNLTANALLNNNEWNNLIVSDEKGQIIKDILSEYERLWNNALPLRDILDTYSQQFEKRKAEERIAKKQVTPHLEPNAMQLAFISKLNDSINRGDKRGLLISATGTGKTFASAFGIKSITKFEVKKLLYVAHRERLLIQGKEAFNIVFSGAKDIALFSGTHKDIQNADYIFSMINTLEKNLNQFQPDEFDAIIIDECHRIGKETMYQKILQYFKPKYLLGMSATPDRTDCYDVYSVFDHNILYEIRLEDALNGNMLTPFHYFGIQDVIVDGQELTNDAPFNLLTCDARVDHIIEKSKYFGYSGNRLKALAFVSRMDEGKILSEKMNQKGYRSVFLSGSDSQDYRDRCMAALEEDDPSKEQLDIIFTVNIFNEGVDIPSVNQLILLRPTESSIIFIQQLGRGLRKWDGKEYLTVIDFIGNYDSNFLIPFTFEKNGSGRKRPPRHVIGGSSVITFDEVTRRKIINAYNRATCTDLKRIIFQYNEAKNRVGHIPSLIEFDEVDNVSGRSFMDLSDKGKFKSYYSFLLKYDNKDFTDAIGSNALSSEQKDTIDYLSMTIGAGLRIHDALLLKYLIEGKTEKDFIYNLPLYASHRKYLHESLLSVLSGNFAKAGNAISMVCEVNGELVLTDEIKSALKNKVFRYFVMEIINYSLYSNQKYFSNTDSPFDFVLYEKYSRKDVCLLINHDKNDESTMYGYKVYNDNGKDRVIPSKVLNKQGPSDKVYRENLNVIPIFVTYNKNLDQDASTNYADCFRNHSVFLWDSRSDRTTESKEIVNLLEVMNRGGHILLFVKREDVINGKNGDNSFYYLGTCSIQNYKNGVNGTTTKTNVVKFELLLKQPVREDIFTYLTSKPVESDQ